MKTYVVQFERYNPKGGNEYVTITRKAPSLERLLPSIRRLLKQLDGMPKVVSDMRDFQVMSIREKELWKP